MLKTKVNPKIQIESHRKVNFYQTCNTVIMSDGLFVTERLSEYSNLFRCPSHMSAVWTLFKYPTRSKLNTIFFLSKFSPIVRKS